MKGTTVFRRAAVAAAIPLALAAGPGLAATLQGKVVDARGAALPNALVRTLGIGGAYSITGSDGRFSLTAAPTDTLFVAAENRTTRRLKPNATSGIVIQLADDPLMSTLVYRNSFDHLRPRAGYSRDDALRDFHTYKVKGLYDGAGTPDHAYIDVNQSHDGKGASFRVKYPKGGITTGDSGVQLSIPLSRDPKVNNFAANQLYFSYWFKFGSGFEFNCGGKMPGLAGSKAGNEDIGRWSGRWMFRWGGSLQYYMHYAGKPESEDQDTLFDWGRIVRPQADPPCTDEVWTSYLRTGKWHHIELRYKLNTPGKADGEIEGWLDGTAAHYRKTGISDFRIPNVSGDITLNSIFFSTFYGGSKAHFAPTRDVYAWFDEFRVSRTRMGYTPPPAP